MVRQAHHRQAHHDKKQCHPEPAEGRSSIPVTLSSSALPFFRSCHPELVEG